MALQICKMDERLRGRCKCFVRQKGTFKVLKTTFT